MIIYAKSDPVETLREHTDKLVENFYLLKEAYPDLLGGRLGELLLIAVKYHDAGKVYPVFQNKIRKSLDLEEIQLPVKEDIPHAFISLLYLPIKKLRQEIGLTKEEEEALLQAIAYHHERGVTIPKKWSPELLQLLTEQLPFVAKELDVEVPERLDTRVFLRARNRLKPNDPAYPLYVLLKGLLHRLDHSSSAHQQVEYHVQCSVADHTRKYITEELKGSLRELQTFALENQNQHLFVVAQTGLGKTEAGLIWLGKEKGFFTLPLRVSINEQYRRATDADRMNFRDEQDEPIAGLLHSTALDYLEKKHREEDETVDYEQAYHQSRQLSRKLTFTTIDQVLAFPLLFLGYEKWLATFKYAKVIIDEIQAYSPRIMAVLVKAMEMIHEQGGKIFTMTATLPTFLLDTLEKRGKLTSKDYQKKIFTKELNRHKINIRNKGILQSVEEVIENGRTRKVLVICNTVGRSNEMYKELKERGANVKLLHSAFLAKDRAELEKEIVKFAPNSNKRDKEPGIWITTQIVEASVDVDFDVLYTELSTLDSLFQRMGRCYRGRTFAGEEGENIFIFTESVSGVPYIYDKELFELSKQYLAPYHQQYLTEETKMKLVEQLYEVENLQGTKFFREFQEALHFLDHHRPYELYRSEAQQILRDIQSVQVIPRTIYDSLIDKFENYEQIIREEKKARKAKDRKQVKKYKEKKREIRRTIESHTVNVFIRKVKSRLSPINHKGFENMHILDLSYEFDSDRCTGQGVIFKPDELGDEDIFI
jgi:CRISPR-associated endonuclease/helicase Cas3